MASEEIKLKVETVPTKLSWRELNVLTNTLQKHPHVCDIVITRKSEREFDLKVAYRYQLGSSGLIAATGWLPLMFISKQMLWTDLEVAAMSDYCDMVHEGDWSGIRDSSEDKVWEIFQFGMDGNCRI